LYSTFQALLAAGGVGDTQIQEQWPVDGLDHGKDRDFLRRTGEFKAASAASPRIDEALFRESLEDFGQEAMRSLTQFDERPLLNARARRKAGKMNHDTNGVIGGTSDLHGVLTKADLIEEIGLQPFFVPL
jgi:hypothetical protein